MYLGKFVARPRIGRERGKWKIIDRDTQTLRSICRGSGSVDNCVRVLVAGRWLWGIWLAQDDICRGLFFRAIRRGKLKMGKVSSSPQQNQWVSNYRVASPQKIGTSGNQWCGGKWRRIYCFLGWKNNFIVGEFRFTAQNTNSWMKVFAEEHEFGSVRDLWYREDTASVN